MRVAGLDFSAYQIPASGILPDWEVAASSGIRFAIGRRSIGLHDDKTFGKLIAGARAAGILCGAYHFATPVVGQGREQAKRVSAEYVSNAGLIFRPTLDMEAANGTTDVEEARFVEDFCDEVLSQTGYMPIVYTGRFYPRPALMALDWLADCPLWLAQYTGPDTPTYGIPDPWRRLGKRWTMWQWVGDAGRVPGFATAVDRNWFDAPTVWRDGAGGVRAQWDSPGDGWTADESLSADDRMRAWLGLDTRDHHRPSSDGIVHGGAWVDDLIAQRKLMTDE